MGATVLRVDIDDAATPARRSTAGSFGELVGQSPEMLELFATLERIAPKELTVLVQGETGTGKEEVARAIHSRSPRASAPFVVIDATSLPESLAESLLFGHERGAFTGADQRRAGFFEAAQGGTVFLDEIGELPAPIQAKFLRVLERREITRVGGTTPVKVDVRVVAATHRDLRHEIEAGDSARTSSTGSRRCGSCFRRCAIGRRTWASSARSILAQIAGAATAAHHRAGRARAARGAALAGQRSRAPQRPRACGRARERAGDPPRRRRGRRARLPGHARGAVGARPVSGAFGAAKERAIERFESAYLAALMKRCAGQPLARVARSGRGAASPARPAQEARPLRRLLDRLRRTTVLMPPLALGARRDSSAASTASCAASAPAAWARCGSPATATTGAEVAVKMGLGAAAREDSALRFRHEARLGAMLAHRSIVRIFDLVEEDDGTLVLVMELLRGETLERYLRAAVRSRRAEAIAIAVPILSALAHAHDDAASSTAT